MSPRAYRLGARSAAIADTRSRVVASAREIFSEDGFHRASLDEVARRADVARATVYHQFGSKVGLLDAVLADFEDRAGLSALAALIEQGLADDLVRNTVIEGCRYWATDPPLCRKILHLAATDPEMQDLVRDRDSGRLRLLTGLVERLVAAGQLRGDTDHAIDVLWLVTSFDAYDLLTAGRGLSHRAAAQRLADIAVSQIAGAAG